MEEVKMTMKEDPLKQGVFLTIEQRNMAGSILVKGPVAEDLLGRRVIAKLVLEPTGKEKP